MLQSIGSTKKWLALPLFGVLILSFVVWGIADVFTGQTKTDTVLTAGAIKMDGIQVQNEVQRQLDFIRRLTGAAITTEQAEQLGLIDRSVEGLVTRALLQQEAARLGIVISDNVIMRAIRRIPEFQNKDGTFNATAFRTALQRVGTSEAAFLADQRVSLAREQVHEVVTTGMTVPKLLQKALTAAAAETRTFETYQVRFAAQPAPAAPDDATLEKFVQEKAAVFTNPEYRALSVVRLTAADIARNISVTDEQVKAYYDEHISEFTSPDKRSFQQVVLPGKEDAEQAAAAYRTAKSFGAAKPTNLDDIARDQLPEELQEAAFGLKAVGDVSAPVESPLGWHVLVLTKVTPGKTADFASASKTIREKLPQAQAAERLYDESARLDDLIAGGASIDEIAQQMNLQVEKYPVVDAHGHDNTEKDIPALIKQRTLLTEAFRLNEGNTSDVIAIGNEGYAIVHVDGVTPAALPAFASIKAKALKAWMEEHRAKDAREKSLKLISDLRAGMDFVKAASTYGAEATREAAVSRKDGAVIRYIPDIYTPDLFRMKQDEVAQFPTDEGIVVVKFVQANLPVAVADAEPKASIASNAQEQMKNEAAEAYVNALKDRYTVAVDHAAIRKLFEPAEQE
ncbi:MAG: SurA N-terminal domain-containing protein [Bdellovibrionales bacterium]